MVKIATAMGTVTLTSDFFANLVGGVASNCYGVKGMVTSGPIEGIRTLLFGSNFPERGVRVSERGGELVIEVHIKVVYGVKISAIVDSISNKLKYTVENVTGLSVGAVDVYVDEMDAE